MIDLECLITRFIDGSIKRIKVRDSNYALEYIKNELKKADKCMTSNPDIKKIYHKYRLGADIMALLNTDKYYHDLSPIRYPELFVMPEEIEDSKSKKHTRKKATIIKKEVEIDWDKAFTCPEINKSLIPKARKIFIKESRKYIAFMELKRRIDEKGLAKNKLTPIGNSISNRSDDFSKGKTNQFNSVPLPIVCKYFMQLAQHPKTKFLTVKEVNFFIDRAFCFDRTIEKLTFHNTSRKQAAIWKLFHRFYEDCASNLKYDSKKKTKQEYVELITSNFNNWGYEQVANNFAIRSKQDWLRIKDLL